MFALPERPGDFPGGARGEEAREEKLRRMTGVLEALVDVVATLGKLAATVTCGDTVCPESLRDELWKFTWTLLDTLRRHHGVTSLRRCGVTSLCHGVTSQGHHSVPSLGHCSVTSLHQRGATPLGQAVAALKDTPGVTWAEVTAMVTPWLESLGGLCRGWLRVCSGAEELCKTFLDTGQDMGEFSDGDSDGDSDWGIGEDIDGDIDWGFGEDTNGDINEDINENTAEDTNSDINEDTNNDINEDTDGDTNMDVAEATTEDIDEDSDDDTNKDTNEDIKEDTKEDTDEATGLAGNLQDKTFPSWEGTAGDSLVSLPSATGTGWGQGGEEAQELLRRLRDLCEAAQVFPWELHEGLGDIGDTWEGTQEELDNDIEFLVAAVEEFEQLWEGSARLATCHLLGTLGDIERLLSGGPGGPTVADWSQRAKEDIPRLLGGTVTSPP